MATGPIHLDLTARYCESHRHYHGIEHIASTEASKLVIDLDLEPLSAPWERFLENSAPIRQEYAAVSDEDFRSGQLSLLKRFVAREQIYLTPFGSQFETAARGNLQRRLASLDDNPIVTWLSPSFPAPAFDGNEGTRSQPAPPTFTWIHVFCAKPVQLSFLEEPT